MIEIAKVSPKVDGRFANGQEIVHLRVDRGAQRREAARRCRPCGSPNLSL